MHIALLRHGKPNYPDSKWIKGNEYKHWLETFNQNGLSESSTPKQPLIDQAQQYKTIVCSNLKRSIESADLLGLEKDKTIIKALFKEAELPYWNHLAIKLPPSIWTAISRTLWLMGYSHNCESLPETKNRAKLGATYLIDLAKENDSVLFVGHGFINHYISKELQANNWHCPNKLDNGYWAMNEFTTLS